VVGSTAVAQGASYLFAFGAPTTGVWLIGGLVIVIGGALVVGFLTPIVSAAAALVSIVFGLIAFPGVTNPLFLRLGTIDSAAVAVALAVLGAGAFSLDAYLFGRREIIIPDVSRSSK
jgi:uncharacterized membrane protein YphA (DoxX/SURF4 family)